MRPCAILRLDGRVGSASKPEIETAGRAFAEPGTGGRGSLTVGLEVWHIKSHLLVGDGFVGQPGSSV